MADSNETQETQEMHSFWGSWFGKIVALFGFIWVLPTDKIFRAIEPGMSEASKRARNTWLDTKAAGRASSAWLKKQMMKLLMLSAFVGSITGALLFHGLINGNRVSLVVSFLIGAICLILLWVLIKNSYKMLAGLVATTTNIATSTSAVILKKVGFTDDDSEQFKLKFENIDEMFGKAYVILPAYVEAGIIITAMPSLVTAFFVAFITLVAIGSGLIGPHIDETLKAGWKLAMRVNYALIGLLIFLCVWAYFLPMSYAEYSNPGALDAWFMNPTWTLGWLGTCIVVGIVGAFVWIIAGRFEGESGKRLTRAILPLTIIAMVIAVFSLSPASEKVEAAYSKVTDTFSGESSSASSSSSRSRISNSGTPNNMKMPDVDYKPARGVPSKKGMATTTKPHTTKVVIPKVKITKKHNGFDRIRQNNAEIEALLGL